MKRILNTTRLSTTAETRWNIAGRRLVLMLVVALVLASVVSTRQAFAEGAAAPLGPEGGSITVLAQAPSQPDTLYAGTTDGGVFKSSDGGTSWSRTSSELPDGNTTYGFTPITMLAVDPHDPLIVYAGAESSILFKSVDGGEHWHGVGLASLVTAITIDPSQPTVLYGGGFSVEFIGGPFGGGTSTTYFISKSSDGGATWKATVVDSVVQSIVVDPSDPHTVYALEGSMISKSTDAGATWHAVGTLIPGSPVYGTLRLAPNAPTTLYIGLEHGIAKSSDGGTSWNVVNTGLPIDASHQVTKVHDLALAPGTTDTLYAATDFGVYTSSDGGASWHISGTGLESVAVRSVIATQTALYAGTPQGAYKSSDNGATWMPAIDGLTNSNVTTVLFDAATPRTVYAGTTRGMYVSNDSGTHWNAASTGVITEDVEMVVQDPAPPYTLYALISSNDLYTSSDSGINWTLVSHVPLAVQALVLNPDLPTTLYAAGNDSVYKSSDAGADWNLLVDQLYGVDTLALDPTAPDTIFAGGRNIYKSSDGGTNWIATTHPDVAGWPDPFIEFSVTRLLVDSHQSNIVYAGTNLGMYISSDGGTSWHTSNTGLTPKPSITALTQDANHPATVYVNVAGMDVFKSTNEGTTWAAEGSGLNHPLIRTLAVNPLDSMYLYAGTAGDGVFSVQQIDRPFSIELPVITRT